MRSILYLRNAFWKISNHMRYQCAFSPFQYTRILFLTNSVQLKNYSNNTILALGFVKNEHIINSQRTYAKKKKSKKTAVEEDEDSDTDEDESFESVEEDVIGDNFNISSKSIPSMRIDTVAKAALGVTKKKVEKEFYASNLRVNGNPVLKKSLNVSEGDEVDIVKGPSPDNERFLLVDRIAIKSIGKITGNGNYPVKFQVFKGLTIENYNDPWVKSSNDPD